MSNIPLPGQTYKHFKGNLYKIVTLATHSETGEKLVIYQALYGDYSVYARPLSMFCEKIDSSQYPGVTQEYRFELQEKQSNSSTEIKNEKCSTNETNDASNINNEEDSANSSVEIDTTEECDLDPLVMEFLDIKDYESRINILVALHHRITDDMITTMAMAADVEVPEGDTEKRYEELKQCLMTFEKYEGCRLR